VTAYRFCRSDDMVRLVEAHNRCWLPHHPDEEPLTLPRFKRWVREQSLWTSSCLIALEGSDPVGFSFGCKRDKETLLLRLAVHPDHLRRGHGRHLLTSISSKLAILGPPRLVAEVPEGADAARALLHACDYRDEDALQDFWLDAPQAVTPAPAGAAAEAAEAAEGLLVPIGPGDLQSNGLLVDPPGIGWGRAAATLVAMGDRVQGLAVLTGDQVTGFILYGGGDGTRLLALRRTSETAPVGVLDRLLMAATERLAGPWLLEKTPDAEFPSGWLASRGFRPAGRHRRMAATARPA
jgi:GNAT superfamily N-acetyltransferase